MTEMEALAHAASPVQWHGLEVYDPFTRRSVRELPLQCRALVVGNFVSIQTPSDPTDGCVMQKQRRRVTIAATLFAAARRPDQLWGWW